MFPELTSLQVSRIADEIHRFQATEHVLTLDIA
jgi:hypothetical protein